MPTRLERAMEAVEASITDAWSRLRESGGLGRDEDLARVVLDAPGDHDWRLVDAALDHLQCAACASSLGGGRRGCPACDLADGYRFAGREPDRPGVVPGNEHALRVSTAVLRAPHRYPERIVRGNELFMPLFLDGEMPTRRQQELFLAASRRGLRDDPQLEEARTFAELVAVASRSRGAGPVQPSPAGRSRRAARKPPLSHRPAPPPAR